MRVGWLTRRSVRDQIHVARQLGLPDDAVAISSAFRSSPVEVFARETAAIWVTATAKPDEADWGRRHLGPRFVEVDGRHGVRVEDKNNIERLLRGGG